ncbi:hypothetical protein NYR82_04605 [Actinobacillus equuli subsp. haemolyticus]|uniref:hypothetical protein n=1 Tax=Actinobacillus equuli TaxID=718 RepID=UPI002441CA68|nr:hypothetical protein [Actinobacillus equuli]WGE78118.1 hypothetical protein NYR82_04605 [Actinobacillus equuli subsp. haemolyticus]
MKKLTTCLSLFIITFLNSACSKVNFREEFFKHRPCAEVKYRCLPESQGNQEKPMFAPSKPYVITAQDRANMEQDRTLSMYKEISQMLEIYYPGFWEGVTDEQVKIAWMAKVDEISKRYFGHSRMEGDFMAMAHICAIIGTDFESKPNLQFIVKKLQQDKEDPSAVSHVIDYLRFEILKKDYDVGGVHYNTWSLRGIQEGMPKITRHIPDFYTESKPQNQKENLYKVYKKWRQARGVYDL